MVNNIELKDFEPLTAREQWLANQIMDTAICIHRAFGPGLMESVYEKCSAINWIKDIFLLKGKRLSGYNMMDW